MAILNFLISQSRRMARLAVATLSLIISAYGLTLVLTLISGYFFRITIITSNVDPYPADNLHLGIQQRDEITVHFLNNYLQPPRNKFFTGDFLVDNSKCRIPNINIWNKQVMSIIYKDIKDNTCDRDQRVEIGDGENVIKGLTYVNKPMLIIDMWILYSLQLRPDDIECCYQIVERVTQNSSNYNMSADSQFRLSTECYLMGQVTYPHSGFVKVTCNRQEVKIHVDFHLIANFPRSTGETGGKLAKKLEYWKRKRNEDKPTTPPNILLIGLDSTSRMHFRRMLPSLGYLLQSEFQAVDFKGLNKVGRNTFPNVSPLMTSYSEKELGEICNSSNWSIPLDDCPFIWKEFAKQNYLTALVEDSPISSIFNYRRLGFLREPVDFYPRPWVLTAYEKNNYTGCIGYRRSDRVLLQYTQDLMALATTRGIPYFITLWLGDFIHDSMSDIRHQDKILSSALLQMKNEGSLDNTILIVLGDHGYNFLKIKQSLNGWYEDKLPPLWIRLPEKLKIDKPSWYPNLYHNSKQLVTMYNLHDMLRDVLRYNLNETGSSTLVQRGGSLFEKLPNRNCEEAGILWEFCSCSVPMEYLGDSRIIEEAARTVLKEINEELPSKECELIRACNVTALGVVSKVPVESTAFGKIRMGDGYRSMQQRDLILGNSHLVLGLSLFGNRVLLEAFLKMNKETSRYEVVHKFQTNKWDKKAACLAGAPRVSDTYCQCKL